MKRKFSFYGQGGCIFSFLVIFTARNQKMVRFVYSTLTVIEENLFPSNQLPILYFAL